MSLIVREDLTPAEGNVALGTDFVEPIMIGSREILQVWEVIPEPSEAESRLRIRLSSPVDPEIAADYVRLEPQIDYRLSGGGNDLVVTGALEPGESYTLTITDGLPATDDASLREALDAVITSHTAVAAVFDGDRYLGMATVQEISREILH